MTCLFPVQLGILTPTTTGGPVALTSTSQTVSAPTIEVLETLSVSEQHTLRSVLSEHREGLAVAGGVVGIGLAAGCALIMARSRLQRSFGARLAGSITSLSSGASVASQSPEETISDNIRVLLDRIQSMNTQLTENVSAFLADKANLPNCLRDIKSLRALLKKNQLPQELKNRIAEVIVKCLTYQDSNRIPNPIIMLIRTRLTEICEELVGQVQGELGMMVDFYLPTEPKVERQIKNCGKAIREAQKYAHRTFRYAPYELRERACKAGRAGDQAIVTLKEIIERHDRNSGLALQTLIDAFVRPYNDVAPLFRDLFGHDIANILERLDLSGMILSRIYFEGVAPLSREKIDQIMAGHGTYSTLWCHGPHHVVRITNHKEEEVRLS